MIQPSPLFFNLLTSFLRDPLTSTACKNSPSSDLWRWISPKLCLLVSLWLGPPKMPRLPSLELDPLPSLVRPSSVGWATRFCFYFVLLCFVLFCFIPFRFFLFRLFSFSHFVLFCFCLLAFSFFGFLTTSCQDITIFEKNRFPGGLSATEIPGLISFYSPLLVLFESTLYAMFLVRLLTFF